MASVSMGFVREVNILSISVAVPAYLTLTLLLQVDRFFFYVLCNSPLYLCTFASTFFYKLLKLVHGVRNCSMREKNVMWSVSVHWF